MEGRVVNGYKIVKKVGQGTYGKVYKVEKNAPSTDRSRNPHLKGTKEFHALKEINLSKLNSKEKANVEREQKTMKSYNHENIVTYKESFIDGQCLYIAMEYCDGGSLFEYMASRGDGLEEEEFKNFLTQIMQGVKFLHKNEVIHRDLKTKNILLTDERTIKIADFGVARSIDSNESTVNLSKFVGTVHYMSPEMISENPKYDEKTDIWSVGCTCYEMATGKYAFDGKNLPRIKQSVLKRELHDFNKMKLCEEMKQTILRMLATDPNQRPSASDVLEFLSTHSCPNTATDQSSTVPKSLVCENIPGSPIFVPNVRQGPLGRSLREDNNSTSELPPNSSRRRESPRDRRRIRLTGVPGDTHEMSGASSVSSRMARLSVSSTESVGEGVPRNSREIKKIIKHYKDQSKNIQRKLVAIFDDYDAVGWVEKILKWCKECSLEETERKAKELLRGKPNRYNYTCRMIRSLKETEDGIREVSELSQREDSFDEDDDTSVASSVITN